MAEIALIKIGGELLQEPTQIACIGNEIVALQRQHLIPVVVHGGGPQISQLSQRLNIRPHIEDGLRITDAVEMEVVEAALSGILNNRVVRIFNQVGLWAVGISAVATQLLIAEPLQVHGQPTCTASRVIAYNIHLLRHLLPRYLPIVAPIVTDSQGQGLNLNADQAALEIAEALHASHLLFLSGVGAVYDEQGARLAMLKYDEIEQRIADGSIREGMALKVRMASEARQRTRAHIYIGSCQQAGDLQRLMEGTQGTILK